jgi:hypothetical protein
MPSSNRITVYLAGRRSAVPAHVALANLAGPEAIAAFTKHRGLPAVDGDDKPGPLGAVGLTLFFRDMLRKAWRGDKSVDGSPLLSEIHTSMSVSRGRIEVAPHSLWQSAFLLFWRDRLRGKTGVCANPKCPARYFIGKRGKKSCGRDDCANYVRRLRKNKWWKLHGAEWRRRKRRG